MAVVVVVVLAAVVTAAVVVVGRKSEMRRLPKGHDNSWGITVCTRYK